MKTISLKTKRDAGPRTKRIKDPVFRLAILFILSLAVFMLLLYYLLPEILGLLDA
jgi:hypothetical protein